MATVNNGTAAADQPEPPLAAEPDAAATDLHGYTPLHLAASRGNTMVCQQLLKAGADVAATTATGATALHLAADSGHTVAAQLLVDAGADVQAANNSGSTPLLYAARHGHAEAASALLFAGACVSTAQQDGLLPLHAAAESGHPAVLRMLLDQGADVSAATAKGVTALHLAAQHEHAAAARMLLQAGADVQAADSLRRTALDYAAARGDTATADVLQMAVRASTVRDVGLSPLHAAAMQGEPAMVQELLSQGANINAVASKLLDLKFSTAPLGSSTRHFESTGYTALHLAAGLGHAVTAQVLVRAGADVEAEDSRLWTPLQYAAANGHAETVAVLLSACGLDPVQRGQRCQSLLILAAIHGHAAVLRVLLDHGADIADTTREGETVLHLAARGGHAAATQVLVDAGANVHAADIRGHTALFWCNDAGTRAVLLSAGADDSGWGLHPLHAAAQRGDTAGLREWMWRGWTHVNAATDSPHAVQPDGSPIDGATALHLAAAWGHTAAIKTLLVTQHWCFRRKAGANVDAADSQGNTALHLAALHGFADAVAALLSAGADVNKPRQDGRKPLHAAAQHGHTAALQLLLRAGATVDALSATGETPLLRAAQQGQLAVVNLLLLAAADPNVADGSGLRPLQAAVEEQHITLLRRLLQAGADCNAPTDMEMGYSLLAVAAAYDSVDIVEALLAAGARSSTIGEFGRDALEPAVDLNEHDKPQLQLALVVALLSCEHVAPSVHTTRAALVSTMQTGLHDISARLLLHLHQAAQQQGISQDDAVFPVYDAQPVQSRGIDERAHTSLALLHAWTADTHSTAAARAELAGQVREVTAVRQGARDLLVQTAASQAAAAAASGEEA